MPSANTIVSNRDIKPPIWGVFSGVLDLPHLTVKFTHKGKANPTDFLLKTACLS